MSFDHAAANEQIAGIIDYAGVCFVIDGGVREYKGLLDRQTGGVDLGDHGFNESLDARLTVSHKDFPTPPRFGAVVQIVSDSSDYIVGHSEQVKGGWEVHLKARNLSTVETA